MTIKQLAQIAELAANLKAANDALSWEKAVTMARNLVLAL